MNTPPRSNEACQNTDRELFRESADAFPPSLHVTQGGGIGINVGGSVHVKSLRIWHALAEATAARDAELAKFRALHPNTVPGPEGMGEEVPATPESTAAYIAELHGEWDGAEKRIQALTAERDALKAENEKIHQSLAIVMQERRLSKGPDFLRELLVERDNLTALRATNEKLRNTLEGILPNLEAIFTICGGTTLRNREELDCVSEEAQGIADDVRAALSAHKPVGGGEKACPVDEAQIGIPQNLHPDTKDLVLRFASALATKLRKAEQKYGYDNGWKSPDWMDECRKRLREHLEKGDPRDVAAYCAFLWHHGASTASKPALGGDETIDKNRASDPSLLTAPASSTSDAADAKNTAIEDAAVEVAAFSRTHGWPKERSIEFFEFAQKLDVLATCLGKKYPYFNKCMSHQPEGGK